MLASSKLCSRTMVILFEHRVAEEAASFVEGARCLTERFRMVAAGVTESSSKIFAVWALCIKGCPSSCAFTLRYLGLCPVQGLSSRFAFSSVAHRPCTWQRKCNDVHADGRLTAATTKDEASESCCCGLEMLCMSTRHMADMQRATEVKELAQTSALAAADEAAEITSLGAVCLGHCKLATCLESSSCHGWCSQALSRESTHVDRSKRVKYV